MIKLRNKYLLPGAAILLGIQSVSAFTITAYTDANDSNTIASGGSPDPFYGAGTGWAKRTGFGFDVNGNTEIFENDGTVGGYSDAVLLETTISGLNPGQEYGVFVCWLSDSSSWTVRAGLESDNLTEFTRGSPLNQTESLGKSSVPNSNRDQLVGFIANKAAAPDGTIVVYIDDGEWTGPAHNGRTWYEGVAVGEPVTAPEPPQNPKGSVEIAPDGAWTWFNDERAIFHEGFLFSGYVSHSGGHVMLTRFDPSTGISDHMQLSTASSDQVDDHNNCAIVSLPDNRLLVTYSKHDGGGQFFYRTSKVAAPASLADWNDEQIKTMPNAPWHSYCNLHRLPGEGNRIYNFSRNIQWCPTVTTSTDNGATWGTPTNVIYSVQDAANKRPYVNYADNGNDRIDLIYTDGHPRNITNSVYHLYYQAGNYNKTDGTLAKADTDLPLLHDDGERGSVVYQYSAAAWGAGDTADDWVPEGRAWVWDIEYGTDGHPVCAFQVKSEYGSGYEDDRIFYYYARWTGTEWQRRFIAQGGRGIYSFEDDYGGGMTIDPDNPNIVYIASNAADPTDLSGVTSGDVDLNPDARYEIYRGETDDGGLTFTWTAITKNSTADNLRPIVPANHTGYATHLLWFYGTYSTWSNWDTKVLGAFHLPPEISSLDISEPSEFSLSFTGVESWDYVIKSTTNLVSTPFDAVITPVSATDGTLTNGTIITTTTNGTATVRLSIANTVEFFRVETPTL